MGRPSSWPIGACGPSRWSTIRRLVGDSVDNVPGVPLIGPKIASEYLQKFDTLDNLLERAGELPKGKRNDNLINMRDQGALESRPGARSSDTCRWTSIGPRPRVSGVNREALCDTASPSCGVPQLRHEVRGGCQRRRPPSEWAADYQVIDTPERLAWLVRNVAAAGDCLRHRDDAASIRGSPRSSATSFAWKPGEAYYRAGECAAGRTAARSASDARGIAAACWRTRRSPRSGRT